MGGSSSKGYTVNPDGATNKQSQGGASSSSGSAETKMASSGKNQKQDSGEQGGGDVVKTLVNADELKDGEMKEIEIGDKKALLIRDNGQYHAVSAKCTHFGAPLAKGVLCNGHVRCPWHGACFSVKSGDIEDFPGLDSLQKFDVKVSGGKVEVSASKSALENNKRFRKMCIAEPGDSRTYLIIGGGGATIACVETLRQEGFKGKIIVATKEKCIPYDRTKLSKAMTSTGEQLAVRSNDHYSTYCIDFKFQKEAISVDTTAKQVMFKDGETVSYDKLLLATGGSPRSLPIPGIDLENVCLLRTPEDANKIAQAADGKNVVIIGTSFIGMEVSSCIVQKAQSLTCLDIVDIPFKLVLGDRVGAAMKKLHEEKGTKFIAKNSAKEFVGEDGKLKEVVLQDETRLPADLCIMGIGVFPTTAFLKDSGLNITDRGFVVVDKKMQTSAPDVFAAGDIVEFPLFINDDQSSNVQHWQMAHAQGRIAALNMLNQDVDIKSVPFFWTVQFGKSLRYTGFGMGYDDIVIHGEPDDLKFVAFYTKGDQVIAVASMNWDPIVAEVAEVMLAGKAISKEEVREDPRGWAGKLTS